MKDRNCSFCGSPPVANDPTRASLWECGSWRKPDGSHGRTKTCFRVARERMLDGPTIGPGGTIEGGVYHGLSPAEVLRQRDEYNRLCGE